MLKNIISLLWAVTVLTSCISHDATQSLTPVAGKLRIGFDIDDTVLFSRDNFLKAPHLSEDPDHVDYGWINTHDSLYTETIKPIAELITFYRASGHEVYFITARPGINGAALARHLSRELGFPVVMNENLFFSTKKKDERSGQKFTTKHAIMSQLGLHVFFGDSDNDMVAASIAGIRAVRVVRDPRSTKAYSKNYFGDIRATPGPKSPYSEKEYQRFLTMGVGPFGETIFPIYDYPESVPGE